MCSTFLARHDAQFLHLQATRGKEAGDHHLVFEALAAKGSVGMIMYVLSIIATV
jgi:signal transduction protein with GAF and PtsI domain